MESPLDNRQRQLLRESAPVAAILLFWVVLSSFVRSVIATGLLRAGVVMALLYVVVRGVALARSRPPTPRPDDVESVLRENARVALPAGVWFLAAKLVYVVESLWDAFGIPGLGTSPEEGLAFVFVGTGVSVVLLYAIAVGLPRVRDTAPKARDEGGATGAAPADD